MTIEDIKILHSLEGHLSDIGAKMVGNTTSTCPVTRHDAKHLCVTIYPNEQRWHCHDCGKGGDILDWLALEQNKSNKDIIRELGGQNDRPLPAPKKTPEISATYDYTDEQGTLLYQVVRYIPKDFRQRQPDGKGGWIWTMDGASRVLYRLPEVLKAKTVHCVEGEKDVESLRAIKLTATCNVGGAGKWLEAYSEFLAGKDIIIIPDTDQPGRKHADLILDSVSKKANSVKVVILPKPYKDVSDYLQSFPETEEGEKALADLIEKTPYAIKPTPIFTLAEMESKYSEFMSRREENTFSLGKLLPTIAERSGNLVPGELVLILADTGVGKTALLQSIARSAAPLPTLIFELELPLELMFERFVQMEVGCRASDVQQEYRDSTLPRNYEGLRHITVCPESGLSPDQIESLIIRSELKIGRRPVLVCVDYIGLIRLGQARSRYEAVSESAEQLKVIAKRTGTIIVMASQIARPDKKKTTIDIKLHDAKDSGSLENSAGLVLGAWRPTADTLMIRILKNTKGQSGETVPCNFDGAKMRITEQAQERGYSESAARVTSEDQPELSK